jgi:phosphatidylglycerophosphatase A
MNKFSYIFSTFFYTGKFPIAPGTFGSLIALPFFYLLLGNRLLYFIVLAFLILLGTITSKIVSESYHTEDPSFIVIDEVAGLGIAMMLAPKNIIYVVIAFVLFRLFDIFKLPFIKAAEHIKNGIGIMLDDILAGLITFVIMRISLMVFF